MTSGSTAEDRFFKIFSAICGMVTVSFGILALAGWFLNLTLLASFSDGLIPMAPSTALFFVITGMILFTRERYPENSAVQQTGMILSVFIMIVSSFLLFFSLREIHPEIELLGMPVSGIFEGIPTGHMSPVTAVVFIFSAAALFVLLSDRVKTVQRMAVVFGLSVLVQLISLILILAYIFGSPILYGKGMIPPALSTSVAFFIFGMGLLIPSGRILWPHITVREILQMRSTYILFLIFLLLVTGIITAGYYYYSNFEKKIRSQVNEHLVSVAGLKARDIEAWRNERLGDAELFEHNPVFSGLIKKYLEHRDDIKTLNQIKTWIQSAAQAYQYDRISIFDKNMEECISFPGNKESADSAFLTRVSSVIRLQKIIIQDFYCNNNSGKIYLDVMVPLTNPGNSPDLLALLALRIDPAIHLYPDLENWPTPSETAETLLVRKNGDSAEILNNLRFRNNTALHYRVPVTDQDRPVVKAVTGQVGIVEGMNYRNKPVIAAIEPVIGSSWFLITHMDVDEIYLPLRERLWLTIFLVASLMFSSAAGVGFIWHEQQIAFYNEKLKSANHIRDLNRTYIVLSEINQAIVRIRDPFEMFRKTCSIAVEHGGFLMAWVGILNENTQKIEVAAAAGRTEDYLEKLNISFSDKERSAGPTAISFKSGKHVIINDIHSDSRMGPWKNDAARLGFKSSAAFPVIVNHKIIATLNLYAREKYFFNDDEVKLLDELAMDISFSLEYTERERERSRAEEAMRISEERYHNALENMIEGCQIIGRDWRYIYLNEVAAIQGRRRKEELLGKTMMECFPGIEKTNMFKALEKVMSGRKAHQMENEFIYPDGTKRWFELRIQPVPEGVFILSMDITDRKLSEEQILENRDMLNRAQAVAHVGSWEMDIIHNRLTWSRETYRIFNVAEDTVLSYDLFLSLIHPDDREGVNTASREALSGKPYDIEHRIMVDGQARWVRERAEIVYDETGKAVKRIGTVQDITEKKQADEKIHLLNAELELRIAQRTRQLEESNAELEAFAYSISHDLRAPLRSIIGFSNILREDFGDSLADESDRVIKTIVRNALRMGQLIDDLLEFSRMGRKNMTHDFINMDRIVDEVIAELTAIEKNREINIIRDILPKAPADRNMIRQVWVNLISNAIKYTRNEPNIRIEIGALKDENTVTYFVKDNGCGFNMKYSDKLFNVFQRLHSQEEFEGTGVGLALVKRIISRHEGRVWAKGEVDKGATFYFSLPC